MELTTAGLDWSKSLMYSIHQTHFLVEKHLEQKLTKARGISFSQFLILLPLHCNKSASQTEVAHFLHLTEATVSRHISGMAKELLITSKEDSKNRRKNILELTKKGKTAFDNAHSVIEKELETIFAIVPQSDRQNISHTFEAILKKLTV